MHCDRKRFGLSRLGCHLFLNMLSSNKVLVDIHFTTWLWFQHWLLKTSIRSGFAEASTWWICSWWRRLRVADIRRPRWVVSLRSSCGSCRAGSFAGNCFGISERKPLRTADSSWLRNNCSGWFWLVGYFFFKYSWFADRKIQTSPLRWRREPCNNCWSFGGDPSCLLRAYRYGSNEKETLPRGVLAGVVIAICDELCTC